MASVYALLHDLVYILVVICLLFVFVVRFVTVSGPSMQPTLQDGNAVMLLSNFLCGDYESGDIVVATVPTFDDARPIVKRVIATEGQAVYINFVTGTVLVDGEMIEEPYIAEPTYLDYDDGLSYPVTVPEGCVFLMGDNRNDSADSRYAPIGCVDTQYILGKVILRTWPLRGFGTIK
ncbi:MAG: signal peptidase I [Oscillospiraceae bacterium]|nr:signal peptidase I [Oscillospiraceae bacterium]